MQTCERVTALLRLFYLQDMTRASWTRTHPYNDDVVRYQQQHNIINNAHGFTIDVYCGSIVLFGAAFGENSVTIENPIDRGWVPLYNNDFYTNVIHQKMTDCDIEITISDNVVNTIIIDGGFAYSINDNRFLHMFAHPDSRFGRVDQIELTTLTNTTNTKEECYDIDSDGDPCGLYLEVIDSLPRAIRIYGGKCESFVENFTLARNDPTVRGPSTFWYSYNSNGIVIALLYYNTCEYTGITAEYSIVNDLLHIHRILVPKCT